MTHELTYRPPKGSTPRKHQQNRTLMQEHEGTKLSFLQKTKYTRLQTGLKRELPVQLFLKRL